jgi:hypothetical protein
VVGSVGPGSRSVPLVMLIRILLQLYKPVNFCDEAVMRKGIRAAGQAASGEARRPVLAVQRRFGRCRWCYRFARSRPVTQYSKVAWPHRRYGGHADHAHDQCRRIRR